MTGRPTDYTDELAAEICERLSTEEGGLFEVCKAEDMPSRSTVYLWLSKHQAFSDMYARAREDLGTYVAHQGVKEAVTTKDHQLGRLQFDARKWLASKLAQKQFGDRQTTELTGADGGPIQSATTLDVSGLSDEQLKVLASIPAGRG
jgi:hypothetical protein